MDINVKITIDEEALLGLITKIFNALHGKNEVVYQPKHAKAAPVVTAEPVITTAAAVQEQSAETTTTKHTIDELRILCSQKKSAGVKIKPIMQQTTGASSFADIPADKIGVFYAAVEAA